MDDDGLRLRELLSRSVHDLRNPLAVVRASLEWLETELVDQVDALDAVRDAGAATSRMLVIVDDLDTLRMLEGGHRIPRGSVDVTSLLGRMGTAANARFEGRNVTIATIAVPNLGIIGDTRLLERSLEALVEDCVRGAPPAAVVEVSARLDGAEVEITIALRGTPLAAVRTASIEALHTSGLGVYLALRVVEAHGGSLSVTTTASLPRIVVRLPR